MGRSNPMNSMPEIDFLLALGPLLVVPLGLSMIRWTDPEAERLRSLAAKAVPFAAAAAAVSLLPVDPLQSFGAVLAALWLAVSVMIAISAVAELLRTRPSGLEPYLPMAACAYLAVGAVWLILYRAEIRPRGFPIEIVGLTAVHFHFAGFAGPILAAQASRWLRALPGKWDRLAAFAGLGVVVAMVLIAVGISASPMLEMEGSLLMAAALIAIAAGTTLIAFRLPVPARALLVISSAAVWISMVLAVQYALGQYTVTGSISVRDMARSHGVLNLVFTVFGLLGWKLAARRSSLGRRAVAPEARAAAEPTAEPKEQAPAESAGEP
jgi:hypothetical protein